GAPRGVRCRGARAQTGERVDQAEDRRRPAGRTRRARRRGPGDGLLLVLSEDAVGSGGQRVRPAEQAVQDLLRPYGGPDGVEQGGDRAGPGDLAEPGVGAGAAAALGPVLNGPDAAGAD